MSNSIWHTADEKPEDGATITFYLEDSMGSGDYDYDENEIIAEMRQKARDAVKYIEHKE